MTQQKNVKKIEKRTKFIELKALQTDKICNLIFGEKISKMFQDCRSWAKLKNCTKLK